MCTCLVYVVLYCGWYRCETILCFFFFQAEDGIRDLVRSRGLGDVYKRQAEGEPLSHAIVGGLRYEEEGILHSVAVINEDMSICLLYTSDAADERSSVDLGGRRIIKKKK